MEETKGKIKYGLSECIYGTVGLFVNFIAYSSDIIVLFRGVIGAIFVLTYIYARGKKIDFSSVKKNFAVLVISGMCLGLNWVFLFSAYKEMSDAVASLCNYTAPAIVVLISPLIYKTKLNIKKTACVGLALFGVVLISGIFDKGSDTSVTVLGLVFAAAASLAFVGIILCNRKLKDVPNYDKTFVQLAVSAITVLPYVIVNNVGKSFTFDLKSTVLCVAMGLVHTGMAYLFFFDGVGNLPVHTVALIGYIEPLLTVLISVFVLGEPIGIFGIIGAVLVISATAVSEIIN